MKTCTGCGLTKDLAEYHWRDKVKGTHQNKCKECKRGQALSNYFGKTDEEVARLKARRTAIRDRNRAWLRAYLEQHPCVDCGESDLDVLQFDHIEMLMDTKANRIATYLNSSLARLQQEVAKCEVRCANCHVRRTRQQMGCLWERFDK